MTDSVQLLVFGEVLFDLFPTGEEILGGAPFNVAWHLQALGDAPRFISRVGDDAPGERILTAMRKWGMDSADIQRDPRHPTGRVVVEVIDREPRYHIVPDCAYDFIEVEQIRPASSAGLLYHGTLGVRNDVSRKALLQLTQNPALTIFLDVNLRTPWWDREEVFFWLKRARWVKLNEEELRLLGFIAADLEEELFIMRNRFQLEQIILTRGGEGVLVCTAEDRLHEARPAKVPHFVDSVGAGDAFSAVYIHGLLSSWSLEQTVDAAQRFAAMIIGRRGATVTDPAFYQQFSDALGI